MSSSGNISSDNLDDDHYPAHTMGRAAEMIGATPGFLRSLDEAKLFVPQRSEGGHRRYTRYQLRLAARVRVLLDDGIALDAACRIVILEDQLAEAQHLKAERGSSTTPWALFRSGSPSYPGAGRWWAGRHRTPQQSP
jgi:hypothetical protein